MWLRRIWQKWARTESVRQTPVTRSDLHQASQEYWRKCSCTFLASDPTYYDRQDAALRDMLSETVRHAQRALDIGCGNGRFSLVLAEFSETTLAFDLSPTLIQEAIGTAERHGVGNIEFRVLDLEQGLPDGPYDLAACMGVVSTIIDDDVYDNLLDKLQLIAGNRGYLITKDSLSPEAEDRLIVTDSYVTKYRSEAGYERAFASRGFQLLKKVPLAKTDIIVNSLYLWQKD